MKKTLLTLALALAFVVLLAMSVFAEDIIVSQKESEEYGTVIQLSADPGLDNAKQYVSTLNKINDQGTDKEALCIVTDGTYFYVFPSSYIVWEIKGGKFEIYAGTETQTGLAQAMAEFNKAMGTSYYQDYAMTDNWGNRHLNNLVRFEFTTDVSWVDRDHCLLRYCSNLEEVRIKHTINFARARHMFRDCKKLTTVVGFEKVTNIESDTAQFMGCAALKSVSLPTDMVKIPDSMFWGCGKVVIDNLNELTQLTTIGASSFRDGTTLVFTLPDSVTTLEAGAFQSAFKDGGSLTINPTSQLQTIGADAFRDCRTLASIYIPSSVTSIGKDAFRQNFNLVALENFENCQVTEISDRTFYEATKIKELKLPKGIVKIGADAFYKNEALTLVYLPSTLEEIADTFTGAQPQNAVYVYIGKDASVLSACSRLKNANVIPANQYSESDAYTGVNLVVGYSYCLAYNNGVHKDSVSDTVFTSYLDEIKIVRKCTLCEMADETGKIPALFEYLGYSADEKGNAGFIIGFVANTEAIKQYSELTGKVFEYGVFVATQNAIGNDDIFTSDGKTKDGVVGVKTSNSPFALFQLKVSGFREDQKDVKLSLGAYIKVIDGESIEFAYLQNAAPKENEKYHFASYNEIINSIK